MFSSAHCNNDDDDCANLSYSSMFPSHQSCVATLRAHSSHVAALAVLGSSLFTAGADRDIRLWLAPRTEHAESFTVARTKSPVKSLVVSGDNGTLLSSHQDGKIRAWHIARADEHLRRGSRYSLKAELPTAADRLVSALAPANYVRVRRHVHRTWVHHVDAVSALAVSHDGALLYSVSWDRALKVWRTAGFRCVESVPGAHRDAINAVAVARDGHVYTGGADTAIHVWRRVGAEERHVRVQTLERHGAAVNALALSVDGRVLYSGAGDRVVVVWEGGGGRMAAAGEMRGHRGAVLSVAAAMAGEIVCSGAADATVRVWRRSGEGWGYWCSAVLEGHGGPVKCLAIAVEGVENGGDSSCSSESGGGSCSTYTVYSGGLDCDVKVWRLLVPSEFPRRKQPTNKTITPSRRLAA